MSARNLSARTVFNVSDYLARRFDLSLDRNRLAPCRVFMLDNDCAAISSTTFKKFRTDSVVLQTDHHRTTIYKNIHRIELPQTAIRAGGIGGTMRRLVGLLISTTALSLGSMTASSAADVPVFKAPPAPVYNWTGLYLGVNGGGAWGDYDYKRGGVNAGSSWFGGLAGGQIGYNWQRNNWVFGLEADLDSANISGTSSCPNPIFSCDAKVKWFGTARGRVGWAFDGALPYITAGLAYGRLRRESINYATGDSLWEEWVNYGWTAGVGLDFALAPNWFARIESLYVDLGDRTYPGATAGMSQWSEVQLGGHFALFRAALNYKFDWGLPIAAKY